MEGKFPSLAKEGNRTRTSNLTLLLLLPCLLLSCGALWQTTPAQGVALERKGEYAQAASALEPAVAAMAAGRAVDPAMVESLYYAWIRQGEYVKARDRFEAWSASNPNAGPIRLAAGRVNRVTGNYSKALSHLEAVLNQTDVGVAASFEKAKILEETGKREAAAVIYNNLIQSFLGDRIRRTSDWIYVAGAMAATEFFQDANEMFMRIAQADPKNAEAFVAWGDLLTDRYADDQALASYRDALKIDPNMPEALLGVSQVLAETDPENSGKALEHALKVNPNFIGGLVLVANQEIESEQYDKARAAIDKVLAINPESTDAYSLLASIEYVRGNTDRFNQNVRKVLQIDPQFNDLYYTLADNSVKLRLYKEAVAFAKEALRLNPRDWKSEHLLGVNLLRIGEEEAGREALDRAWAGDKFNPGTKNTLTLLDSWALNFTRVESPHFNIKLHKKESAALKPYVVDLLEKAYKTLTAKYDFTPEGPLTFEMYPDHEDFAVRTLGLPGLGALGVCFGKLFVMDSPSARKPDTFNWGGTLWHEFTHVITLQMTDHKVPRWFSEGLSVYEERRGFPGWGDDLKVDYLMALKSKKFLPIAELNDGFIRPKYPQQVLVSYYEASLVADYIDGKWGFPAIRKMLLLYKAGKTTPEVFQEALNQNLDAFDADFMKWVNSRIAGIDLDEFKKLMTAGREALEKNDLDKAIQSLGAAVAMYPEYSDEHNPYEPLAEAYLKKGDKRAAMDTLKKFLTYDETSYASHLKYAQLLEESGDIAGAAQALEGGMYIRPMDFQGHEKLGTLLLGLKQFPGAAREYETLIALNAPDRAGAYYHLAEANFGEGKREEARKNVLKSIDIAPSYEPALDLLLKIRK